MGLRVTIFLGGTKTLRGAGFKSGLRGGLATVVTRRPRLESVLRVALVGDNVVRLRLEFDLKPLL